jgi:ATP-dependent helicase/nuclease subunit A
LQFWATRNLGRSLAQIVAADIARPDGKGAPLRVTGQIDRLLVAKDHVLIVDYKTNRPPPTEQVDVPESYLLQLVAYRLALRQITGLTRVEAAILWTDGTRLMPIDDTILDAAEVRLWSLDATKR